MNNSANTFLFSKSFWIQLLLLPTIVFLGLLSRSSYIDSQTFIGQYAGDTLWAAMVYLGFRLLLFRKKAAQAAIVALLFAFGIEFLQLYQAPWIQYIRATTLGALVLGHGFLWIDLLCYSVGVGLMFLFSRLIERR